MDNKKQNAKPAKRAKTQGNVVEQLKDIGSGAAGDIKDKLIKQTSEDFLKQLLGQRRIRRFSGEVSPGESLEMNDVMAGKREENLKLKKQIALEKRLRQEEKEQNRKKVDELRLQLQAVTVEIQKLSSETQDLAEQTKVAAMSAQVEPGVYHLVFFEKLLEFITSFRKKIHEANIWLEASNKRAQKKNAWGARYKKHGAKFLLSGEHYLTRSAG